MTLYRMEDNRLAGLLPALGHNLTALVILDSPKVTAEGLSHIDSNKRLRNLELGGLGGGINDALLKRLHQHKYLTELILGRPEGLQEAKIAPKAVIDT